MESTATRTLASRARQTAGLGLADRRTWTRLGYLAAACPMGWIWLVALLTLLAGGIALRQASWTSRLWAPTGGTRQRSLPYVMAAACLDLPPLARLGRRLDRAHDVATAAW